MIRFGNRLVRPLTPDERMAEDYLNGREGWLAEIARETGNRGLRSIAIKAKAERKAAGLEKKRGRDSQS